MVRSLALLLILAASPAAADVVGRVVGVSDGDTITVLTDSNLQERVRLALIDAPESKQPFGAVAKKAMSDLVFGKLVAVVGRERDNFGRIVGTVYVLRDDANSAMVSQGAAWVYRQYTHDPALLALEAEAKAAKRGLWAQPDAVAPWEWRKLH